MKESVTCFRIDNIAEVEKKDPAIVTVLEKELALAGAIPSSVDTFKQTFCVVIKRRETTVADIISIFAQHGLSAHVEG